MVLMKTLSYNLFRNSELIPLMIACLIASVLVWTFFRFLPERKIQKQKRKVSSLPFVKTSIPSPKLTKKDLFAMAMVTGLYAAVSFHQLGSTEFVNTTWQPVSDHTEIVLELKESTAFDAIYAIYNEGDNNSNPDDYQLGFHDILVEGSSDMRHWEELTVLKSEGIFEYDIIEGDWDYPYVKITSQNKNDTMTEFALRKPDHSGFVKLEVSSDSASSSEYPASLIIDEQDLVPLYPTYVEEGYFDEVYHPRNAWEIAEGQRMYATVHPLFGTNLMALSIKLFGLSPFAWRLPGAIAGALMIPILYLICKEMFRKTFACTCGAILLAGDFMHITTSRIGTLEPFSVLFILIMFLYMIRWFHSSFYDTPLKKQLKNLFLCGLWMGIAVSTKWTGCYSGAGLAAIFFAGIFQRFYEYRKASKLLKEGNEISELQKKEAEHIRSVFVKYTIITLSCCIVFFILIPIAIYVLTYLPDHVWKDGSWSLANVWKQTKYIYWYHRNVTATHPYQSVWWQWLLDIRPMWYHRSYDTNGWYHTISCFSNPLLCIGGLLSMIYVIYSIFKERNGNAFIIAIGFLSALCPWLLVDRCVFSYHFYPTSMFAILAMVYAIDALMRSDARVKPAVIAFMCLYTALFVLYLPATCGFGTSIGYTDALELLPSWHFG